MGLSGPGRMGTQPMDQHFIVMMIPHHEGAIAMADLALTRAKRPEIKELAKSIMASQTLENARCRPDTGSGSAAMSPTGRPVEPWAWAAWARVVAWVWTRAWPP